MTQSVQPYLDRLQRCPMFMLPSTTELGLFADYGYGLIRHGVFARPFPLFGVKHENPSEIGLDAASKIYGAHKGDFGQHTAATYIHFQDEDLLRITLDLRYFSFDSDSRNLEGNSHVFNVSFLAFLDLGDDFKTARTAFVDQLECAKDQSFFSRFFTDFCALTGLLNTPHIKREIIGASQAVNAKREKKGKRPLPSCIVLKPCIDVEQAQFATGSKMQRRTHWRRGHMRRIPNGEIRVIAPTLVNGKSGGQPVSNFRFSGGFEGALSFSTSKAIP